MVAIELVDVSKRYGMTHALDHVTFGCSSGQVTAFCGPNGAGKSTALRVLTGIVRADSGLARVGASSIHAIDEPARHVGVLLDASAFHPGRTVIETLRLGAMTIGMPCHRADACADMVGLASVRRRRAGKLSLGMRQRLGIAHALLGDPAVLVLDEPANGLDPAGIDWLNGLLRRFADGGGSVLISTHHLAGLEQLADRLVVISRGRIVADTEVSALGGHERSTVSSADPNALVAALDRACIPYETRASGLVVAARPETVGALALDAQIVLTRLAPEGAQIGAFVANVADAEYEGTS